jgi:hypothetical protein
MDPPCQLCGIFSTAVQTIGGSVSRSGWRWRAMPTMKVGRAAAASPVDNVIPGAFAKRCSPGLLALKGIASAMAPTSIIFAANKSGTLEVCRRTAFGATAPAEFAEGALLALSRPPVGLLGFAMVCSFFDWQKRGFQA